MYALISKLWEYQKLIKIHDFRYRKLVGQTCDDGSDVEEHLKQGCHQRAHGQSRDVSAWISRRGRSRETRVPSQEASISRGPSEHPEMLPSQDHLERVAHHLALYLEMAPRPSRDATIPRGYSAFRDTHNVCVTATVSCVRQLSVGCSVMVIERRILRLARDVRTVQWSPV